MNWQQLWENISKKATEIGLEWGPKVLAALGILVGGWIVARITRAIVRKGMTKAKVEPTLVGFVANLGYMLLMTIVFITALAKMEIPTGSFVAVIGAAGLAIGFALQGSLSNFAAGVMIILFRPFRAGDVIEGAGVIGMVEEIQVFATVLKTGDSKRIIIPNSALTGGTIINYSANPSRRIDLVFGIGYGDDIDKAKKIVTEILEAHPKILKDPAATVAVGALADSSVNLFVRPWVKNADYWAVFFDLNEQVKKAFDKQGVSIPFPQRDVHLHQVA